MAKNFVADYFTERLWSLINEEFCAFQNSRGIEDGGLDPWLSNQLDSCVENLVAKMDECMQWKDTWRQDSVQVKTAVAVKTALDGGVNMNACASEIESRIQILDEDGEI